MKKIFGIGAIVLGAIIWFLSYEIGGCFMDSNGYRLCTGLLAPKYLWFLYWIAAALLIFLGIKIIISRSKNKS